MRKKKWITPVLTVLVKGAPEESVLAGCKHGGVGGPSNYNSSCNMPYLTDPSICSMCSVCTTS